MGLGFRGRETPGKVISVLRGCEALRFGEFTLRSGQRSPYFMNVGMACSGADLAFLGGQLSLMIREEGISLVNGVLYGPPYKGIPLAVSTAMSCFADFAYARKEEKDHGEKGNRVGASLYRRNVVIIDDVISSGSSIRESVEIIEKAAGKVVGVFTVFDRQEEHGGTPASKSLSEELDVPVKSLAGFDDLMRHVRETQGDIQDELVYNMMLYRDGKY